MPILRIAFGRERFVEICVVGEQVIAQRSRNWFAARFLKQLCVGLVRELISGGSGNGSGIKVLVWQLKFPVLFRNQQCPIVVQGLINAVHIHLLNHRSRWMKGESAERSFFWHKAQKERFETRKE